MTPATHHATETRREPTTKSTGRPRIEELARHRLANDCPYSFYFRAVNINYADGILTLRGRVPTFYLKQILQTLLARVDGVRSIDNQVDVSSATGLSSVRYTHVRH